jgi:hypothetical protein
MLALGFKPAVRDDDGARRTRAPVREAVLMERLAALDEIDDAIREPVIGAADLIPHVDDLDRWALRPSGARRCSGTWSRCAK